MQVIAKAWVDWGLLMSGTGINWRKKKFAYYKKVELITYISAIPFLLYLLKICYINLAPIILCSKTQIRRSNSYQTLKPLPDCF